MFHKHYGTFPPPSRKVSPEYSEFQFTTMASGQSASGNGIDNPLYSEGDEKLDTAEAPPEGSGLRNRQFTTQRSDNVEIGVGNEEDPLGLMAWKKSETELSQLKSAKSKKKLQKFYKDQNETIDELLAPVSTETSAAEERRESLKLSLAVYGSLGANFVLFGLQLTAALFSGSLALFATMADAFMDLLSSFILVVSSYLSRKQDLYGYPQGKTRFETVGIVIFGTLMSTLSLVLITEAVRSLASTPATPELDPFSLTLVGISLAVKLTLFLYCRLLDHPTAQILAMDHRNDICANSLGIVLAVLGAKVNPILDPIGAIVIAIIIFRSWTSAVMEHSQLIVGKCADPNFLKRVTYIAMTHDERILQVDTCRAYHSGSKVIVEVDIVLPPETSLQVTHDLGESLQIKLESLPNVERAFVHCDYETTHKPEHRKFS